MGEIIIKSRTLKSGKVVYEYAFEIASVDGKRKRKTKCGFKTKKEAREAGKLAQQAYESIGQPIEPSSMSYSDFLDQWIENDIKISSKCQTFLMESTFSVVKLLVTRTRDPSSPFVQSKGLS